MENVWKHLVIAAALCIICLPKHALADTRAASAPEQDRLIADDCGTLLETVAVRRAMQLVQAQLLAKGMKLLVQGCPFVRVSVGEMRQVMDVRVQVVNSEIAANFVRGPLADGEEVDMGAVMLGMFRSVDTANQKAQHALQLPDEDVSPDVLFNRQWLAHVMKSRGLQPVSGHWWAFVPVNK